MVEALVEPAVGAENEPVRVARVEGHGVVVAVFVGLAEGLERLAAVTRQLDEDVHLVDEIAVEGGGVDLLVVVRPGATTEVAVSLREALAAVGGSIEAPFLFRGFDGGVDVVGVDRRDRESDLSHVAAREAALDLAPGRTAVRRLVDAGFRSAGEERPGTTTPLIGRRPQDVGVVRMDLEVGRSGVRRNLENECPALAAVGGLEDATLAARRPQRSFRGDPDGVRVARVHDDLADVLGAIESQLLEALAAVPAAIDAVTPANVSTAHVLSGAHPDGVGCARVERHGADRVGAVVVEDRRPGRAGVDRLPDSTGAGGDVPGVRALGVHRDVRDAARHQGRADFAHLERLERWPI